MRSSFIIIAPSCKAAFGKKMLQSISVVTLASIATPERLGIIIELKYAEDGTLEKSCAEALAQIEAKQYAEGLRRRGMRKILKYGIAFWEKECQVMLE